MPAPISTQRQQDDEKALPQRRGDDAVHDRGRARRRLGGRQLARSLALHELNEEAAVDDDLVAGLQARR